MSEEKTTHSKLSEARRRANKKYNDRFVEMKVRVTPEKRSIIKEHAEAMGESATRRSRGLRLRVDPVGEHTSIHPAAA